MYVENSQCLCPRKLGGVNCIDILCGDYHIGVSADGNRCLCQAGTVTDENTGECIIDAYYCNKNFTSNYNASALLPVCKCIPPAFGTTCYDFPDAVALYSTFIVTEISPITKTVAYWVGLVSALIIGIAIAVFAARLYYTQRYYIPREDIEARVSLRGEYNNL